MADSKFYIYVLFRETGVPFYVGKGQGYRWLQHTHTTDREPNRHKRSVIRQMRANGFEVPKIKLHDGLTEDVAFAYEKALIAAIGRADKGLGPLVNLTDGGEGVSGLPPESRARVIAAHKGSKRSAETRAKLSAVRLGKKYGPHSPEHRARIAAAHTGRKRPPEVGAKISAAKKASPATAAACIGRKLSIETRAKLSAARLAYYASRRLGSEAHSTKAQDTQP